jgi:hypothetical protein
VQAVLGNESGQVQQQCPGQAAVRNVIPPRQGIGMDLTLHKRLRRQLEPVRPRREYEVRTRKRRSLLYRDQRNVRRRKRHARSRPRPKGSATTSIRGYLPRGVLDSRSQSRLERRCSGLPVLSRTKGPDQGRNHDKARTPLDPKGDSRSGDPDRLPHFRSADRKEG